MRPTVFTLLLFGLAVSLAAFDFGQNKVQPERVEWSCIHTMHFDIYYRKGADEFGKTAALMAEDAYYYLKDRFKTPLIGRIPLIFYQSHQEFEATNIVYPLLNEGVAGFTESFKTRVVIPFDGSYAKFEKVLVHELTHVYQKTQVGGGGGMLGMSNNIFPFWLQEGQPEYMAIGGKDDYNNMFILDMVLNNTLQPLDNAYGYYAYRMGEAFLVYLSQTYGPDKVMEFYRAIRMSSNMDEATKKVFGYKFDELQDRWHNELKRQDYATLKGHTVPYEAYQRHTNHKDNDTYFNYAPALSPDGTRFVYFSDKGMHLGIWLGSTYGVVKDKRLLKGEETGRFQEFHYLRNNLTWFPDSRHIAFVATTVGGDRIYVMDVNRKEITASYKVPGVDIIYGLSIAPDGQRIAFSGQHNLQTDLFIYDIASQTLTQLTDDPYDDGEPCWSPDGNHIAFASERTTTGDDTDHIVYKLRQNIFIVDVAQKTFVQVTNDPFNNHSPLFDSTGDRLLFITDRDHIANYEAVDLASGNRARLTNTLCGVFPGNLSDGNEDLIFSCYYDGGWDVYSLTNPLDGIQFNPGTPVVPATLVDDFNDRFKIDRYQLYGPRDLKFELRDPMPRNPNTTAFDFRDHPMPDSLVNQHNMQIDARPDTVSSIPKITPYKPVFSVDHLWGGMAYSSSGGSVGYAQFSLSDLMGDHGLGVQLGISGKWKDSNFIFNYLYLANRIDYGIGAFKITDASYYADEWYDGANYYDGKEEDNTYGGELMLSYPFNRYWRVDFEGLMYHRQIKYYYWDDDSDKWNYISRYTEKSDIFSPQLTLIHDNALYGSTGPIDGWRLALLASKNFSSEFSSITNYVDVRKYWLLSTKYSLAMRTVFGASYGQNPEEFELDGFGGVRGLSDDFEGSRLALTNLELRYPMLEHLKIGFPLPMEFNEIRGSIFVDSGAAWDPAHFVGMRNGQLEDIKFGYGFGPRINLSYFVLKFDIAWHTDFVNHSKPNYYLSLAEDF